MSDEMAVTAESAPATETPTDPTAQAPSQPVNNGQPQYKGFHEHPDWQRMVSERRQDRATIQQLTRQVQELTRAREDAGRTQPTREEMEAREALYRLDPNLKGIGDLSQKIAGFEGVATTLLQNNFFSQGDAMIGRFAQQHGLKSEDVAKAFYEAVSDDPAAMQRVERGDVRLITSWLKGLEPVVATMKTQTTNAQREGAAATAQTKQTMLRTVPPRPAGSQSGPAAPKPLTGDFRKDMKTLNDEADAMLRSGR